MSKKFICPECCETPDEEQDFVCLTCSRARMMLGRSAGKRVAVKRIGEKALDDHVWCARLQSALRLNNEHRKERVMELMDEAVEELSGG